MSTLSTEEESHIVNSQFETYRGDYIRSFGLVASASTEMLADSPEGLIGLLVGSLDPLCAAIEVKTMTSPATIQDAQNTKLSYGKITKVPNIGGSSRSGSHFRKLVQTTAHRMQCSHHAVVLGIRTVLFVVAKGSRNGVGEIIYATILEFSELFVVQCVVD